jgi:hypothetical protein
MLTGVVVFGVSVMAAPPFTVTPLIAGADEPTTTWLVTFVPAKMVCTTKKLATAIDVEIITAETILSFIFIIFIIAYLIY